MFPFFIFINPSEHGRFLDRFFKVLRRGAFATKMFTRSRIVRYGLPQDILSKKAKIKGGRGVQNCFEGLKIYRPSSSLAFVIRILYRIRVWIPFKSIIFLIWFIRLFGIVLKLTFPNSNAQNISIISVCKIIKWDEKKS